VKNRREEYQSRPEKGLSFVSSKCRGIKSHDLTSGSSVIKPRVFTIQSIYHSDYLPTFALT